MWTVDSLEKSPRLGRIEGRRRRGHQRMGGWHCWYNGHELGQTLGYGEGQGGLACCSPLGRKESDSAGWLNNNYISYSSLWSFQVLLEWVLEYNLFARDSLASRLRSLVECLEWSVRTLHFGCWEFEWFSALCGSGNYLAHSTPVIPCPPCRISSCTHIS